MRLSSQTLGATVCEGVKYKVARMPSGSFRVSLRSNPEVGAVFYWQANFRWAVGEPKPAEEVDSALRALVAEEPVAGAIRFNPGIVR